MDVSTKRTLVRSGIIALVTFCYLLPNELAEGRNNIDLEIAKHKGTIKTIESENGEVIDCVDIYKQPAFDHPLLKNHTIEMWPASTENEAKENDEFVNFQVWHKNGEYCPEGSVPIARKPKSNYPKKGSFPSRLSTNRHNGITDHNDDIHRGHEYATAHINGGNLYGANTTINVWVPFTFNQEFSLAQVWILAGQNQNLNTVEAGWMVNSGSKQAVIFIYWTSDNYASTGCYNLQCAGFVQVTRKAALGAALHQVSTYNGQQYDMTINIHRNHVTGHWWLHIHNVPIGYWPHTIFTSLANKADEIHWGGEIINRQFEGHHTTTQMGSGHFPHEGFQRAGFFRNLKYRDQTATYREPAHLIRYVSKPSCYNLELRDNGPDTGVHFYYGGPGYSDRCRI